MVTNSLTFVDKVDLIVVLDKGCISEYGTFTELLQHQGPFTEFLEEHLRKKMERSESDDSSDDEDSEEKNEDEVRSKYALFNSLDAVRCCCNFKFVIYKYDSVMNTSSISCPVAVRWIPLHLSEVRLMMVWVMAWCCQFNCNYFSVSIILKSTYVTSPHW